MNFGFDNYEIYMNRCLELASMGIGNVAPNPMVGSVIVHEGKIIGEGFHRKCGEAHAEVNAINSVKNKSVLSKSTIFVNLEPCSHFGKTPPCTDLIIKHKIPNVIIGSIDTFSEVSGKGIEKLKAAGCNVTIGVLESYCRDLNRRFFTFHEKKRPYVILKWAQTLDGFIDKIRDTNAPVEPTWITCDFARIIVHKWRSEEQAIMVATNTAKNDNPKLNTREFFGKNPLRILLDRKLNLSKNLSLLDQSIPTLVFNELTEKTENNLLHIKIDFNDCITSILKYLHQINIQSVIIEGGAQLFKSFIDGNIWDEARVFIGNKLFFSGCKAPVFNSRFKLISNESIGKDKLLLFKNVDN